ncbi:MAG: alkaline phosphatase family protein, partial [Blastococcus sp.]
MGSRTRSGAVIGTAVALAVTAAAVPAAATPEHAGTDGHGRHVLLVSVDGMHQSDLDWFVRKHPNSALADLMHRGIDYSNASTPFPSDSFPGMVGQVTGGNPRTTGVYYDVTYNRALLPAGTTDCAHAAPGAAVPFDESVDKDSSRLDAGQGLAGLPAGILRMTSDSASLLDPAKLPVDPRTCRPVHPNQYLQVNTVFDVAAAAGLRTAWSDKHPAYQILNGPNPHAIADQFDPEINSDAPSGGDWSTDNADTQQYDGYKVQAVLNQIDGYDHSRAHRVGEPAIFGMNFQTVSTAQKLPSSNGLPGGYQPGGTTPGPLLSRALEYVDAKVGAMVTELHAQHHDGDTTVILSAKHGQSPTDPNALTRVDDGPIIDGINTGWASAHPGAAPLVAFSLDDDGMLLWLSDRSPAATQYVRSYLMTHPATGNGIDGGARTVASSGLSRVEAGPGAAAFFGVGVAEPRHPDVVGIADHGVVYTGKKSKIAEHGGNDPQDRHVPLLVAGPGVARGTTDGTPVETTQIA